MFFPIDCHIQKTNKNQNWLVVSTHLKNISQIGNLPQIGMKMKNIWNHQQEKSESPKKRSEKTILRWLMIHHDWCCY